MRVSTLIVSMAAVAAIGMIVFNVGWRGHYVYCDPIGALRRLR